MPHTGALSSRRSVLSAYIMVNHNSLPKQSEKQGNAAILNGCHSYRRVSNLNVLYTTTLCRSVDASQRRLVMSFAIPAPVIEAVVTRRSTFRIPDYHVVAKEEERFELQDRTDVGNMIKNREAYSRRL